RLGSGRGDRRLAESFHDSARAGLHVDRPEGLELRRQRLFAALLLQSEEREKQRRRWRIELDAIDGADSGVGGSAEIREAARHAEADRERATAGSRHARRSPEAGPGVIRAAFARLL